jgi:hypothetical protein
VYPNEDGNDFASAASTMMIDPYIDDDDDDADDDDDHHHHHQQQQQHYRDEYKHYVLLCGFKLFFLYVEHQGSYSRTKKTFGFCQEKITWEANTSKGTVLLFVRRTKTGAGNRAETRSSQGKDKATWNDHQQTSGLMMKHRNL